MISILHLCYNLDIENLNEDSPLTKIVIKLTKESRKQIAANFVNDRFRDKIEKLNQSADSLAEDVLERIYCVYPKNELETFVSACESIELSVSANSEYYSGVVAKQFKEGRNSFNKQLSEPIYTKNKFVFNYEVENDFSRLTNNQADDSKIAYSQLKTTQYSELARNHLKEYNELYSECFSLESRCYALLKNIRTVDNLLKNWSDAYKYLPDNLEVEEPNEMSLSEKFALL